MAELRQSKKEQRIKGEVDYSISPPMLKAEVGETVEYRITVKNTGNTTLKFEALKDAKCTNFSPALAPFELAAGSGKGLHVRTRAGGRRRADLHERGDDERRAKKKRTPPKKSKSKSKNVTDSKSRRNSGSLGEGSFTTAKLSSEVGKKVEYKIMVTNTGNTTLKFSALKDTKCSGVLPAGETTLKAGESETFTCEHVLTEADENPYKNTASIEANKETKTSNTVEVEIKRPNFEVKKEQRIKGEADYSISPPKLKAEVGETVEYRITVKNTGNTTLKFEALKDAKCTNFSPALAAFVLAPGRKRSTRANTCWWKATGRSTRTWRPMKAGEKEKPSKEVEVEVKERHEFEIEKEQRMQGEGSFTTAKLSSEAGKKVEYQMVVKNTGNTTLKFSALKDTKCSGVLPAGETTLKAGESETFSCEHVLTEADENPYKNTASIEANKETKTSNTVEVEIKRPNFEVIKEQRIKGEAGLHESETAG